MPASLDAGGLATDTSIRSGRPAAEAGVAPSNTAANTANTANTKAGRMRFIDHRFPEGVR
jgi:hypothetical protein